MSESDPNPAAERPESQNPAADEHQATTPPPPTTPPVDTTPPADLSNAPAEEPAAPADGFESSATPDAASSTATGGAPAPNGAPASDAHTTPIAPAAFTASDPTTATTAADNTTTPTGTATTATGSDRQPAKRFGPGLLVASLAVGALVGGASGAGVTAWALAANSGDHRPSTSTPQNVTINNTDDVNVVNAVAAKASPSVVKISVSGDGGAGGGSGVVLSEDGYILTNAHVVTLGGSVRDGVIEVETTDGALHRAEVVGIDPTVDLAVIRIDATGLTAIEWGDSSQLDVGDRAVAIGAPLGLENTVTDGIVSALGRSIDIESSAAPDDEEQPEPDPDDPPFNFDIPGQQGSGGALISIPVIQTDAAINHGNSGGALVNDQGELIGINVAIATPGGVSTQQSGSIGVGFAIPSNLAQRVAEELIEDGTASHGLLGASVRDATSADGTVVGAYVADVTPDGAARAAGLREGDIITGFNGVRITDRVDITAQVRSLPGGAEAELTFVRGGDEQTVTVTLGEYEG